jgi:MSHA pilin protein MshC
VDGAAIVRSSVNIHQRNWKTAGFTLIELVVTLIVVAILAVMAIPKLNTRTFDTTGFFQEALASVRYAQKEAVAKRRVVCVTLSASSLTINFASVAASTTCNTNLVSPRGVSPFTVTAANGVTLSPAPVSFFFDGLGRPFDAANTPSPQRTITITGDSTQSFVVEAETGYVH